MDSIKKYFPLAFKAKNSTKDLVINVLVQVVVNALIGVVFGLLAGIPLVGGLFDIVGWVVGIYFTASIVLSILDYFKILK